MSFLRHIDQYKDFDFAGYCGSLTTEDIAAILDRDRLTEMNYLALLSDAALPLLESMAQKANALTRRHFGRVVFMFTPLYISNYCDNVCPYCSFSKKHDIDRNHLSPDEIRAEAAIIAESGIRHILFLTGESRGIALPAYCREAVATLRDSFSSVSIEIYPLTEEEYRDLIEAGVDGLTIFQETYGAERYERLHRGGPKSDYNFRIEAPERACRQGIRSVGIGALLGLGDPVADAFFTGLHAAYLQHTFSSVEVSISFPRLRPLVADFTPGGKVNERKLVQLIAATRLFLPTAGITLSTRESARFRDAAASFGVTRMSAGVSTAVAGRSLPKATPQFEIADTRTVDEMKRDLLRLGFQPVMHDWNGRYVAAALISSS